jgi:hypothetical protein
MIDSTPSLQRERGVAAAVIELDSLPDAVGPAAQNHDLLAIRGRGFALRFVAGIEIRREAFELGRTGIDAIEDGRHAQLFARVRGRLHFGRFPELRDLASEMPALGFAANSASASSSEPAPFETFSNRPTSAQLLEEPGIDRGHFVDLLRRCSPGQREADVIRRSGVGRDQLLGNQV